MSDGARDQAAVELYGRELLRAATPGYAPRLRALDERGEELPLALERFLGDAAAEEHTVLDRAVGPVLDVGCGPGRHVVALGRRGVSAVGLDISPLAVRLARRRGAAVIEGSVFDVVPRAGQWASALLLDGNIGIGGEPSQLLARVAALLRPGGLILAEIECPGVRTRSLSVRLVSSRSSSRHFPWAQLGVDDLATIAASAGLLVSEHWGSADRWFAALVTPGGSPSEQLSERARAPSAASSAQLDTALL